MRMRNDMVGLTKDFRKGKIDREDWKRQMEYLKGQIIKTRTALGTIHKQKQ
jgi:hypothetical protein